MYKRLKVLFSLLTKEQRRRLLGLQILVVFMAFAEVLGVAAIGPFMSLVGDMGRLEGDGYLAKLYALSGLESPRTFMFITGVAVLGLLTVASAISVFTLWRLSLYAQQIGAELATRLYTHYMNQDWLFHASGSSSQLTNKIAQECGRITNQIIQPLMLLNAKATMAIVMITVVLYFNPIVAIVGGGIFGGAYLLIYKVVRRRLIQNGHQISASNRARYSLMNEGFGGIKDTLLLGRQGQFVKRFESASRRFGRSQGVTLGLSQSPRYIMELVAFWAVIFLVLYLLAAYEGNLGDILPVLSIYALAGFKLLPALQQVYTSVAQIRGNLSAFDNIEPDLTASASASPENASESIQDRLSPTKCISLRSVCFRYPGKDEDALKNLNIDIPINTTIALVGASGSGKSTAVDLLLGLIKPRSGGFYLDDRLLDDAEMRTWQNNLGFVPQSIFLSDSSIRENIAFGLPLEKIEEDRIENAVEMAHLKELIENLPEGLDTRVGERGVQLSGGQRQRIGIARALYNDAEVLVLDEATSALDGITEKFVMDAIGDFSGKKTVIMIAHRLATVRKCDMIFFLDNGAVSDCGTYDELIVRNEKFKRMAEHS